jgi:hypothetical protein
VHIWNVSMEYGYSKDIAAMHKFRQDARSPVIGGA